jgi:hypothetical protein
MKIIGTSSPETARFCLRSPVKDPYPRVRKTPTLEHKMCTRNTASLKGAENVQERQIIQRFVTMV